MLNESEASAFGLFIISFRSEKKQILPRDARQNDSRARCPVAGPLRSMFRAVLMRRKNQKVGDRLRPPTSPQSTLSCARASGGLGNLQPTFFSLPHRRRDPHLLLPCTKYRARWRARRYPSRAWFGRCFPNGRRSECYLL